MIYLRPKLLSLKKHFYKYSLLKFKLNKNALNNYINKLIDRFSHILFDHILEN